MLLALLVLVVATTEPVLPQGDLDLCDRFRGHDQNGDGEPEIADLQWLSPEGPSGDAGRRILVLVEQRLLGEIADAPDLRPAIARLVADLEAEGHRARAVAVTLGTGRGHQDGCFLLALRELLRAAHREDPLEGVLLVGRFPDALIVRTCNWRRQGTITLRKGTADARIHKEVRYVRRVPEDVAHRGDIVLADLDGRWEDVYVSSRVRLPTVVAVFPNGIPAHGGDCTDLEQGTVTFQDFFHVSDGKLEIQECVIADEAARAWRVTLFDAAGDHECGSEDRARPNPLARPDILVSRIDARGVSHRPRAALRGEDGEGLLDPDGRPRTVRFATPKDVPHWRDGIWESDPILERRLLLEFLDRNHAYRKGVASVAWRPASIACGLPSGYKAMARAATDWQQEDRASLDVHRNPTLAAVMDWLSRPALLRTVRAHSDAWGSVFARAAPEPLDARLPGPPWSWTPRGDQLVPSLAAACGRGKLDWFLLRTLWEWDALAPEPSFYVHTGCHGISPPGALSRPYSDESYGARQGAEALLFFARGLALVGRAKVFYDEPREFSDVLAEKHTFGRAWARYFDVESEAASWPQVGGDIGRKRAYFWSVLGDWTLTLTMGHPSARR
jgi:hypothetical protein